MDTTLPPTGIAAFALAAAASLAGCGITEPPPPPSAEARFVAPITLTAEAPVVVREIEFSAAPGTTGISSVEGFLRVTGPGGELPGQILLPDVWVTVIDPLTGRTPGEGYGVGHASIDGWGYGVPCAPAGAPAEAGGDPARDGSCSTRRTVIVRWLDPAAGAEVTLQIAANLTAHPNRFVDGDKFEPSLAITELPDPSFDGVPALARVSLTGSAVVATSSPESSEELLLRIPASLLDGEPGYPRLGRLFFSSEITEATGPPASLRLALSIDDRTVDVYGGIAGEMDWLSLCEPGVDCELPITLTTRPWVSVSQATAAPDGSMSIDWVVEARLEDHAPGAGLVGGLELLRSS